MVCRRCGKKDNPGKFLAGSPYVLMMISQDLCFTCAFWEVLITENGRNPLWCRIEGTSYIPESLLEEGQKSKREWGRGFGGAEFHVEMDDGTKFRTDNLWCQGAMPGWMRELYPDNAKFSTDVRFSWHKGYDQ